MRKLFAVLATIGLIAATAVGPAAASHKSQSKHAHPDCGIEVDMLGVCLF